MKLLFVRSWPIWLLLFFLTPNLLAQQRVESIEIRHVGPPAASDELIASQHQVKLGDTYTRTGDDDDVRTLYSTGLFYRIRVVEERNPNGINLVYVVQGKPVLTDIGFEGNEKYKSKKLLKKVSSKIGQPLDDYKLFSDSQAIQEMYQKAGYQKTRVKARTEIDEPAGRGKVTFEIAETPKVKIERVDFIGADAFPQKGFARCQNAASLDGFPPWISLACSRRQCEEDKENLAVFFRDEGYIDF